MRVSALIALSLAVSAPAQVIVTPGQDLQAAIDQAPDGGWVWVQGGSYDHIQVRDKSLAIIAFPPAGIAPGDTRTGSIFTGARPAAVEAIGSGTEWLYLHGLAIGGGMLYGGGSYHAEAADGARVDHYAQFAAVYCGIWADRVEIPYDEIEPAAHALTSTRTPWLHVEACDIRGGNAANKVDLYEQTFLYNGGMGISCDGALTLIDSHVSGGDAEQNAAFRVTLGPFPPHIQLSISLGGIGGTGVGAGDLRHYRSTMTGGRGARVYAWSYQHNQTVFLGQQPDGPGWAP